MVTSDQNSTFFQYVKAWKPCTNPVPLNTKQYQVTSSTSTIVQVPSTIIYQPVPPYTVPVPPSTIIYQPVPPSTDPVPPSTNQYHSILTWYHQVSTSTNLYCCCLGITDSCTVYPGSCFASYHINAFGDKSNLCRSYLKFKNQNKSWSNKTRGKLCRSL